VDDRVELPDQRHATRDVGAPELLRQGLKRNAGLPTREVVTAAAMLDDDALLVLRDDAEPFGALAPERPDDELLAEAWRALALIDELRIAHQQIDPETMALGIATYYLPPLWGFFAMLWLQRNRYP
jgi:hypothetical protein